MENSHSKGHENLEDFIDIDVQLICRLCFSTSNLLPIYGEDNEESQFAFKINTYLPIKVSEFDTLPLKICSICSNLLNTFDDFYNNSMTTQKRLENLLSEIPAKDSVSSADIDIAVEDMDLILDGSLQQLEFEDVGEDPKISNLVIDRILAMTALDLEVEEPSTKIDNIPCEFCEETGITTENDLKEHLINKHTDLVFHCETCDNYINRSVLMAHMVSHAIEQNAKIVRESSEPNQPKETKEVPPKSTASKITLLKKCYHCDKVFANRSGRLYHMQQVHLLTKKKFKCNSDDCNLEFNTRQTLENHVKNKHQTSRQFECDECLKTYKTYSALYNHKIYHKNDKKFCCKMCDKKFMFNFLLINHVKDHDAATSDVFSCTSCDKTFSTRNKLTKHKQIHNLGSLDCKLCSFKCQVRRYLLAHTKRMHGKLC